MSRVRYRLWAEDVRGERGEHSLQELPGPVEAEIQVGEAPGAGKGRQGGGGGAGGDDQEQSLGY